MTFRLPNAFSNKYGMYMKAQVSYDGVHTATFGWDGSQLTTWVPLYPKDVLFMIYWALTHKGPTP